MLELSLLEAIWRNEGLLPDALWALDGPVVSVLNMDSSSSAGGPSIRNALRILENLRSSLYRLVDNVEDGMDCIRSQCRSTLMSSGICGLPDDILHLLFSHVRSISMHQPCTLPSEVTLSHVCRRFRYSLLASPSSWSNIHSWYPKTMLDTYFRRSQDAPLSVEVCLSHIPYSSFLETSCAHVGRWKELRMFSDGEYWLDEEGAIMQKVIVWMLNYRLYQLGVLRIECPAGSFDNYTNERCIEHLRCVGGWSMPYLRSLKLINVFIGQESVCQTLTEFSLTIGNRLLPSKPSRAHIRSFLQSSTSLTTLTISVFSNFELGPIVLHGLRALRLNYLSGTSVDAFQKVLAHIHAPLLNSLDIQTKIDIDDCIEWIGRVTPVLANFSSVSDFTFLRDNTYSCDEQMHIPAGEFSRIIRTLPSLRKLRFGSLEHTPTGRERMKIVGRALDPSGCPPLARIRWENIAVDNAYLTALLHVLRARPGWDEFEALDMVDGEKLYSLPKAEVDSLLVSRQEETNWTEALRDV